MLPNGAKEAAVVAAPAWSALATPPHATQPLLLPQLLSFIPAVDVGALLDSAAGRTGTGILARTSSRSSDTEATD